MYNSLNEGVSDEEVFEHRRRSQRDADLSTNPRLHYLSRVTNGDNTLHRASSLNSACFTM